MTQRGTLLSPPIRNVLLVIYLLFTLLPIIWLFLSTVQTQASLLTLPVQLVPREWTLRNYVDIFQPAAFGENSGESTFFLALRNSVVVSVGTTLVAMVFGTLAAYAFARFNIPHKRTLLLIVLGSQLLPAISIIIPLFRMFRMVNTLHPDIGGPGVERIFNEFLDHSGRAFNDFPGRDARDKHIGQYLDGHVTIVLLACA